MGSSATPPNIGTLLFDPSYNMGQGWKIFKFKICLSRNLIGFSNSGKGLGLFNGIDAQIGLEIELHIEHIGRITRLLGDNLNDFLANFFVA